MLSPTAQRMMDTLPDYYWGNPITERILQGWANEFDRIDAWIDELVAGMNPTTATDAMGMLALWELTFGLPANPPGATVEQRQSATRGGIRRQSATAASDVLALLRDAIGDTFEVLRGVPDVQEDTIVVGALPGTWEAARVESIAAGAWTASRRVWIRFGDLSTVEVQHRAA